MLPQNGNGGIGSTRTSGLSTVHSPSVILQGTPITLMMASVSHLLCGSNLLISRTLNTPSAFTMNILRCCFASQAKFRTGIWDHSVHWICGDLLCQHLLAKRDELLCRLLAVQSFKWRLFVTTLLASGQDASCMLHQSRQGALNGHLMVRMTPRSSITAFSMSPFDSFVSLHRVFRGDLCFAHFQLHDF